MAGCIENVSFSKFCDLVDVVSTARSPANRLGLIEKFISGFPGETSELYPFLRLLLPEADQDKRGNFGLKEAGLARLIADCLCLPERERDRLIHWRDPGKQRGVLGASAGDFASVVYSVLLFRGSGDSMSTPSGKSIRDINMLLDKLINTANNKDDDSGRKKEVVMEMITSLKPREIQWLIKIIIKNLNIHVGIETVLNRLHPKAKILFNQSNSLLTVLESISKRSPENMDEEGVSGILFSRVKPMLAKRLSVNEVFQRPEKFSFLFEGNKNLLVEQKFDGERIIAHVDKRKGGRVMLLTRNGKDYTSHYGNHLSDELLRSVSGQAAILDGEVVAWDERAEKFLGFGHNKSVSKLEENFHLCFEIFDLIFYLDDAGNSFDLRETRLCDRNDLLKRVIGRGIPQRVECVDGQLINSCDSLKRVVEESADRGEEGVVLKDPESKYTLNNRGGGWWKIKPDYADEGESSLLDLIVVGGYFSDSHKKSGSVIGDIMDSVTSFLVAVVELNNEEASNAHVTACKTVGKIGSGFSLTDLSNLREKMRKCQIKKYTEIDQGNEWLFENWKPKRGERPDVVLCAPPRNKDAIVLVVKAAEITRSANYSSGYTLRFPRSVGIREDKDAVDCTTMDDIRDLEFECEGIKSGNPRRVFIRKMKTNSDSDLDDKNDEASRKRMKRKQSELKSTASMPLLTGTFIPLLHPGRAKIENNSLPLSGKEVFVANGGLQVQKEILAFGGKVVPQYIPNRTHYAIAEMIDFRVQNLVKNGSIDVLNKQWLKDACPQFLEEKHFLLRSS